MQIKAIKTHRVALLESLEKVLDQYVLDLEERSVVAITSKIVSVCEGRCVQKSTINKYELIKREADCMLKQDHNPYDLYLTIKDGLLIPSAGIDESNVDNVYVLYPSNVWESAENIWRYLRKKHNIAELGVLITDSHTTIMRRGVTGITLGWCGMEPLYSYIGKPDLYEQPLKVTQINIVDALATSAVFVMGEGNEQTPIAILSDIPHMTFLQRPASPEEKLSIIMNPSEDLYAPLLQSVKWDSSGDRVS